MVRQKGQIVLEFTTVALGRILSIYTVDKMKCIVGQPQNRKWREGLGRGLVLRFRDRVGLRTRVRLVLRLGLELGIELVPHSL